MGTLFSEWEPRASEKRYFHQDAISIRATMEDRVREGKPQRGAEGELGGGGRGTGRVLLGGRKPLGNLLRNNDI